MSTTPSTRRARPGGEFVLCGLALLVACGCAYARTSDRNQVIQVSADHQEANLGDNGKVILTGHVRIEQGSLGIQGDKAVGYENASNQWDHAVVNGSPAQFHQTLDDGSKVNGSAATIDYRIAESTVILTGDARVVQRGRGTFHGAKLTYNTSSGKIVGEGGAGGQVHMTFQPKSSPARHPGTPAPAASVPAPATSSSAPAAATSTGGR